MDHSIYGYLSRRSKAELEQIIAMYRHLSENRCYKQMLNIAEHFLEKRKSEDDA